MQTFSIQSIKVLYIGKYKPFDNTLGL